MNFKKLTCLASLVMLMTTLAKAADVKVKIVNDERFQRQELVEIDVKDVCASRWTTRLLMMANSL